MKCRQICRLISIAFFIGFIIFSKSPAVNVDSLLDQMTLEEKIDIIGGYENFNIRGYKKCGIPEIHMADGPVGVRNYGKAIAFPASICLAASWDKELAYRVGKAIAMEARAKNVHIMLGPGMNIYRMPLCGRNFEYLGEDPFLAGKIAASYIKGMQDEGVVATAKHFVANNQEYDRHNVSSDMDERTLHEIYLTAFRYAVKEGKVGAIMSSYNLINGIHASQHYYLLTEVLRNMWGFDGIVMSDWVSTYDGIECAKAGLDLEMPSGRMMNKETLIPAIEQGIIIEDLINTKVKRILSLYNRFGFFENPDLSKDYLVDSSFIRETAIDVARGGIVLLKNEKNFLPVDKNKIRKIAIIGPNGNPIVSGGGGSSFVQPLHPVSLFDAVKKIAGDNVEVAYEVGLFTRLRWEEDLFESVNYYYYLNGRKNSGVIAEYFSNIELKGEPIARRTYKKLKLINNDMWDDPDIPDENYSARYTCYFIPAESGWHILGVSGDDGYRVYLNDKEVIENWRDQADTPAQYDCFLEKGEEYKIVIEYYQRGGDARIRFGIKKSEVEHGPEEYLTKAKKIAEDADFVILSVGFNRETESEGFDRTFEMPYKQDELIKEIAEVNKNCVVVLNAGGNVDMNNWIDNVKALIMAWYPGQEGNIAVAEAIFGIINPSGKLPASFEYRLEDNPCYNSYFDEDGDKRVYYKEGIFVGYRYWDKSDKRPMFPFGFGLSYTKFDYKKIKTDKKRYKIGENVIAKVLVKNMGEWNGKEIIQLYIADKKSTLPRPVKELKGFEKVFLKKGEEKWVAFSLGKDAFAYYNPDIDEWMVEPGEFEVLVGSSSDDIRLRRKIIME
ncbi:MAG: glycoside hydrolase family 3 C-terminal domain-containing protein [Candidatus Marinimicrobia bacterium]|nr:glycoside hydrolase family 3 C-terminal domain-containing protein [Candidatus Neomarinimicrobiota bacterium]